MGIWENDSQSFAKLPADRLDDIQIVLGAFRSIRSSVAYVSMPITSGKLFYEVLEHHGVKNQDELSAKLPDALYAEVIRPNIDNGIALADRIQRRTKLPIIAPSVFEAKKHRWSQDEYMYMWYRLIEERVREMYMMDGWEYSNGGSQEFVRAMEMQFDFIRPDNGMELFPKGTDCEQAYGDLRRVRVFDEKKREIRIDAGANKIAEAILDLQRRGFSASTLNEALHKLLSMAGYYLNPFTPSRHMPPYEFNFRTMRDAFEATRIRAA